MKFELDDFIKARNEVECGEVAAAILVLAHAVNNHSFDSEGFGHELALSLKNVFQESEIKVSSR
jgi:hypothetical protein